MTDPNAPIRPINDPPVPGQPQEPQRLPGVEPGYDPIETPDEIDPNNPDIPPNDANDPAVQGPTNSM